MGGCSSAHSNTLCYEGPGSVFSRRFDLSPTERPTDATAWQGSILSPGVLPPDDRNASSSVNTHAQRLRGLSRRRQSWSPDESACLAAPSFPSAEGTWPCSSVLICLLHVAHPLGPARAEAGAVVLAVVIPAPFADHSVILFLFSQPVSRGDSSTYCVPEVKGMSPPSSELTAQWGRRLEGGVRTLTPAQGELFLSPGPPSPCPPDAVPPHRATLITLPLSSTVGKLESGDTCQFVASSSVFALDARHVVGPQSMPVA